MELSVPISVKCPHCGKRLKAPDSAAGKKAKCPGCGEAVQLPKEQVFEAEEVVEEGGDDEFGLGNLSESDAYGGPAEEARKPCPMCGEMIVASAAKCRYCGEIFDETLKRKEKKKKKREVAQEDSELTVGDWVGCILCSGIGCIYGLVVAIQGKPKGWKMVGISIAAAIFWTVVRTVLELTLQNGG